MSQLQKLLRLEKDGGSFIARPLLTRLGKARHLALIARHAIVHRWSIIFHLIKIINLNNLRILIAEIDCRVTKLPCFSTREHSCSRHESKQHSFPPTLFRKAIHFLPPLQKRLFPPFLTCLISIQVRSMPGGDSIPTLKMLKTLSPLFLRTRSYDGSLIWATLSLSPPSLHPRPI